MSIGFYGRGVPPTGFPYRFAGMKSVSKLIHGSSTNFNFVSNMSSNPIMPIILTCQAPGALTGGERIMYTLNSLQE